MEAVQNIMDIWTPETGQELSISCTIKYLICQYRGSSQYKQKLLSRPPKHSLNVPALAQSTICSQHFIKASSSLGNIKLEHTSLHSAILASLQAVSHFSSHLPCLSESHFWFAYSLYNTHQSWLWTRCPAPSSTHLQSHSVSVTGTGTMVTDGFFRSSLVLGYKPCGCSLVMYAGGIV